MAKMNPNEMKADPSNHHNYLNFEFNGWIHIVTTDSKLYALCNLEDLELDILDIPHINLFGVVKEEKQSTLVKEEKEIKIMENGPNTYNFKNMDPMVSVKIIERTNIMHHEWYTCCIEGHTRHASNDQTNAFGSVIYLIKDSIPDKPKDAIVKMGKLHTNLFHSPFSYMIDKCNHMGGGLGKNKEGIPTFSKNLSTHKDKKGLGFTQSISNSSGSIEFVSQVNLIELSDSIEEELWIYHDIPL